MNRCALIFQSIHHVLASENRLKATDLTFDVIPVPKEISPNCGMAVEFYCKDRELVLAAIEDLRERIIGTYRLKGRAFLVVE